MNKIFKVIWNEARNAYVVVSEIAKNHGSKSCSTKKLLAMLIATGVMTCASFDVLAEKPVAATTAAQQYVALKAADFPKNGPSRYDKNTWGGLGSYRDAAAEWNYQNSGSKNIGDYTYKYDATNKYWVRDGYVLTVDENGGKYTPLSANEIHADVAYTGTGVPEGILQSVTSTVSANGTVTNMGESLSKVTAGSFAGVSHSGGTEVAGSWNYTIQDSSWKNSGAEYQNGYVDLIDNKMPKGFITAESNKGLVWDKNKQAYIYKGKAVDYSNVYVIDGKIGVFTNKEGTKVYTGTVYGKNNEILMTVKDANNNFYSYWAAEVTDPSATMATYRVEEYKKNLAVLEENDNKLSRDDIKKVTLDTSKANSAIIGLLRNGGNAVDGAITVTSGGGTGGSGAAHDTFVKISNAADMEGKTFATGSKVEAIVDNGGATTGIKINGQDYTIKSGSKVSVTQTADKKTTNITVDGQATTITDTDTHNELKSASLSGKTLTITGKDNDSVNVDLSSIDTDTKYTAGNGITISGENNAIAVKLKEGENNLEVTEAGLELKKELTVNRVEAGDFYMSTAGIGYGDKAYITSSGLNANSQKITNVKAGEADTDAVNVSQLKKLSATAKTEVKAGTNIASVEKTTGANGQDIYTINAKDTTYAAGNGITISGENNAISVKLKDGENNLEVTEAGLELKKDLTVNRVEAGDFYMSTAGIGYDDKAYITRSGLNANSQKITGVAAGEVSKTSTDAINGSQLNQTNENVAALDKRVTQNEADIAQNKADIAQNKADIAQNKADIAQNKADIAQNKADIAQNKADIAQNKADIATNKADIATNKADIATNKANIAQNAADIKKVEALAKKHTTVAAGDNITVSDVGPNAEGGKEYKVALNNDITVQSVKAGDNTTISDKGLEIKDGPSVTKDGINAGNKKVTGVADGDVKENSKDAINGGQLHQVKADINNRIDGVENQVISNSNRINQLGNRVNKVGAGAAALAALHPMDFDPDDKLTFSAGYGNYGGENAAAIGAYYRPDEKVMFSVAGTVGNGENMVNAGVSFALDRTNHVSNSRTALAREVIDLRGQLAVMGAKMAKMEKAFGMLDETKTKLFPDVPANHWAYEYIAKLAGNGYIEGYPDGNFGGDRLMTRYEFAAMLYRAIEKGAALEEKIIKEFEPELGRIRVDRISGEDGDRDKIERVRVNDTKGERDHYGNKLAK